MFHRRKTRNTMEFTIGRLGATFKKQESPACACCGYDADWLIRISPQEEGRKTLVRMFCEQHMQDALLDAINFSCSVPDFLTAA